MRGRFLLAGPPLLAAGIFLLAISGDIPARGGDPNGGASRDAKIRESLVQVIEEGRTLYNNRRDHVGCYRLFQGALLAVRPLLAQHADLQNTITTGITEAERIPVPWQQAFALRKVIDQVRERLASAPPAGADKRPADFGPRDKKQVEPPRDKKEVEPPPLPKVKLKEPEPPLDKEKLPEKKVEDKKPEEKKVEDKKVEAKKVEDKKPEEKKVEDKKVDDEKGEAKKAEEKKAKDKKVEDKVPADKKDLENKKAPDDIEAGLLGQGLNLKVKRPEKGKADKKEEPKEKAPADEEKISVHGNVTYAGKPLPSGFVTLVDQDGRKYSASIKADGSYAFRSVRVPPGDYRVAIENSVTLGKGQQRVAIPQAFQNADTSGLTVRVNRGENDFNIQLQER